MLSNLLFMLEIIVAEALFTHNLKRRQYYYLRTAAGILLCLGLAAAFPVIDNALWSCFVYLVLASSTILAMKFIYKEPWINVIFCGIAAYTTQHLAYQFSNFALTLIVWGESPLRDFYFQDALTASQWSLWNLLYAAVYLICFFTVYVPVYFVFGKRIRKGEDFKIKNKFLLGLLTCALFINIVLNAVLVYNGNANSVINSLIISLYICFCCFLLLSWQFELIHSKRLQTELDFVGKLLQQEKEQYRLSKETIEMINLKCHDMKHQIREIGISRHLSGEAVEELENQISIYDSVVKTDNEALDVILTEKSFKCLREGIVLSCIADGKQLGFMKDSDVYSLFGNALDNAIEAVLKLDDREKRVISLKVYSVNGMTTINIKNYYLGEISFKEDKLPRTTKADRENHGYGMMSIQRIVDKYDGNLSVKVTDCIFNLNILIPIREESN